MYDSVDPPLPAPTRAQIHINIEGDFENSQTPFSANAQLF